MNLISEGIGENATMVEYGDHLDDNRKYAIFSLTSWDEENKKNIESIKLVEKVNGVFKIINFDSYRTFKPILDEYYKVPDAYAPLGDYIESLIHSDTSAELAINAFNFMSNQGLSTMQDLIETHLTDRLSKPNEC